MIKKHYNRLTPTLKVLNHRRKSLVSSTLAVMAKLRSGPLLARIDHNNQNNLKTYVSGPVSFAMFTIIFSIAVFGIWGSIAPLDSAVIARGVVVVDGNRKDIQHYEGGIISEIVIKEGDTVKKGQPLIRLNASAAQTMVNSHLSLLRNRITTERRLIAEMNGLNKINFSHPLLSENDPETSLIIRHQEQIFATRTGEFQSNLAALGQELKRSEVMLNGLLQQNKFMKDSVKLQQERLRDVEDLHAKGIVSKHAMLAIRREHHDLQSRAAHITAEIMSSHQEMAKIKTNMSSYKHRYYTSIAKEYESNHIELLDLENKYAHHKYVLERTVITAPIDGVITGLRHHTVGGVIRPGEVLMHLVPKEENMVIEAFISPHEINNIYVGSQAKVSLDPYKQRLVPRLAAEVIYVSADRLLAERMLPGTLPEHYLIKLRIKPETLQMLTTEVKLYPGMPVTVFIVRGSRTFMEYMLSPITESFHRALKEQ